MEGGKKVLKTAKKGSKKTVARPSPSPQNSTAVRKLKETLSQKLKKEYPCYDSLKEEEKKKLLKWFTKFYQAFVSGNSKALDEINEKAPSKIIKKGKC